MTFRRLITRHSQCVAGFVVGAATTLMLLSSDPHWWGRSERRTSSTRTAAPPAAVPAVVVEVPHQAAEDGPDQLGVNCRHQDDDGPPLTEDVRFRDWAEHHDDDSVATELASRVRVLVMVMTQPQNLHTKAAHVRNTWGKRANKLLFMSSTWNRDFPTIGLDVPEGRDHLTAKTMQAFRYLYDHHVQDADWFMKADDDTYVILENLRYLLSAYSPQDPVYFGKVFDMATDQGYASGGAGYVLSREALRRLATQGVGPTSHCRQDGGSEDAELGICLKALGVRLLPSTDRLGRSRFHCFSLEQSLRGGFPPWYSVFDPPGSKASMVNISDYPITFHYVRPKMMYAMEYLVYHLRLHGVVPGSPRLNRNDTVHLPAN